MSEGLGAGIVQVTRPYYFLDGEMWRPDQVLDERKERYLALARRADDWFGQAALAVHVEPVATGAYTRLMVKVLIGEQVAEIELFVANSALAAGPQADAELETALERMWALYERATQTTDDNK